MKIKRMLGIILGVIFFFGTSELAKAEEIKIDGDDVSVVFNSTESDEIESVLERIVDETPNLKILNVIIEDESESEETPSQLDEKGLRAAKAPFKITNIENKADTQGKRIASYDVPAGQTVKKTVSWTTTASVTANYGASVKFIESSISMKVSGSYSETETIGLATPNKIGNRNVKTGTHNIYVKNKNKKFSIWKLEKNNYVYKGSPIATQAIGKTIKSSYVFR